LAGCRLRFPLGLASKSFTGFKIVERAPCLFEKKEVSCKSDLPLKIVFTKSYKEEEEEETKPWFGLKEGNGARWWLLLPGALVLKGFVVEIKCPHPLLSPLLSPATN